MRRTLATATLLLLCACGSSPSAPSVPLPFDGAVALGNGRRTLTIAGDTIRCGDVAAAQTGTSVGVDVMSSSDSGGWTLRQMTEASGSFEIRIERALRTAMFGAVALIGTARGYAIDSSTQLSHTPTGTRLTFAAPDASPVMLDGSMPFGSLAAGAFQGTLAFSRGEAVAWCPPGSVAWSLSAVTPD